MALFGKKSEGGAMDVIRCDEDQYLIWKWRPSGSANSTHKENSIRWGSSLRVKDGEVAAFVYKQKDGTAQDFITGPFDETIKTANFPVLAGIVGLAYAGGSPFQAEVYFINLAGNIRLQFGIPWFDIFDPRFLDYPVKVTARGSLVFNITDYRAFIKLHRLIDFDLEKFKLLVRDSVNRYIKSYILNAPQDHGLPVLQIERKLDDLNDAVKPRVKQAFEEDFGVNLVRLDIETVEVDKTTPEYAELRRITADQQTKTIEAQGAINIRNLDDMQAINAEHMRESLGVQRDLAHKYGRLETEQKFITAHQIDQQAGVLRAAAENLGSMSNMNLGGGGGGGAGGGFNPVGVMTGLAVGGAMGGQMANMMAGAGQQIQQPQVVPPPAPKVEFHVHRNGQSTGPFDLRQLAQMAAQRELSPDSMVWRAGMPEWQRAQAVGELSGVFVPQPPPVASYYFAADGQQQGPFAVGELATLAGRGTLRADTLVWKQGMPGWQAAGQVDDLKALFSGGGGQPPPLPADGPPQLPPQVPPVPPAG